MEALKVTLLLLFVVPLLGAINVEEELMQLRAENRELTKIIRTLQVRQNNTEELEARVTVLEETMVQVENDIEDQDDRINTLETEILDNDRDIEELVDTTTGLSAQVFTLEENVAGLDQRVDNLEFVTGNGTIGNYPDTIFFAALETDSTSSENPVVFEWDAINPGGHYDPSTGYYTVPYDGIYQFHVQMQVYSSSYNTLIDIYVDGSAAGSHYDSFSDQYYRSATVLLELQAGQEVHVYCAGTSTGDSTYFMSYFQGYMISAN